MDILGLPLWYQYTLITVLGLIIGSFCNVVIYRFHTGRSVSGQSHCLSCGTPLKWYELVPVFSYLAQRGRCRTCGSYIPVRYLVVELLTAATFLMVYMTATSLPMLALQLILFSLLIVILVYDFYHLIIPDLLVGLVAICSIGLLAITYTDVGMLLWYLGGGVAAAAFYGSLWLVSKGRWIGLGDAKLALPLAILLGPLGAFSMVVLSFWVGSVISLTVITVLGIYKRGQSSLPYASKRFTIKSEVPFAPFIIASFAIVYLYGLNVITALERLFS